ncbi:MAG: hypothetical protein LBG58_17005 [Planctomycetaceae bacterium]|nr:hypothetical protein [Planctomycetaceae bacterium]
MIADSTVAGASPLPKTCVRMENGNRMATQLFRQRGRCRHSRERTEMGKPDQP